MFSRRNFFIRLLGLAGLFPGACGRDDQAVGPEKPGEGQKPDPGQEPEPPNPAIRFAVCSDGHYGQPGTDYPDSHQKIVSWLNAEKADKGLDLVIFNGDLIHDDARFLPELHQAFKALESPYYVARGNHDMFSEQLWKQTWGYLPNHTFETELYGFILGDTSNEKGQSVPVDKLWLRDALEGMKDKLSVFIFLHIPQGSWSSSGVKRSEVMQIIESYPNVCAVFHGHQHEKDNIEFSGGKPYIFDGHFGGSWGLGYAGYRIVEITADRKIRTFQVDAEKNAVVNEAELN